MSSFGQTLPCASLLDSNRMIEPFAHMTHEIDLNSFDFESVAENGRPLKSWIRIGLQYIAVDIQIGVNMSRFVSINRFPHLNVLFFGQLNINLAKCNLAVVLAYSDLKINYVLMMLYYKC